MKKKLQRLLRLVPLAFAFTATLANAQTTGTIIGVVTDASTGKPVPDALVVTTSAQLQGEQTALTDESGNFRITLLPSGTYKISIQREGYKPAERGDITVQLDKTIRANIAIIPEAVTGEVQVVETGKAPVINVGSAESGAVVSKEFLANVPIQGRDFQAAAIVAPGAQGDVYGISFSGATSPENNYILDGMNVTDPAFGTLGSSLLSNFVEEVDVKTNGFAPEYGRATGGVVNVVTKGGSNEFHGEVFGYLSPGALSLEPKPIGRNAEAIRTEDLNTKRYDTDFGGRVGGPILKDRLWFGAGFAPRLSHRVTNRYIQALQEDPANPGQAKTDDAGLTVGNRLSGTDKAYQSDTTRFQGYAKLNYSLTENHGVNLSFYTEPGRASGLARAAAAENARLGASAATSRDLIVDYKGKLLNKHLILQATGGWHHQNDQDLPSAFQRTTAAVQWVPVHPLSDFEAVPAECTPSATFNPCPVTQYSTGGYGYYDKTNLDRYSGKLNLSGLFAAAGHHTMKGGVDLERSDYDHVKAYSGGRAMREIQSGTFGRVYQDFRQYGRVIDPTRAEIFNQLEALAVTHSYGYYLQDNWSILDSGVTVVAGLRWETQDMYDAKKSGPAALNINDNIAPRVQAIWDFTGQGRGKVAGSWGRFYESIPLDMADREFAAESQVQSLRSNCVSASSTVGGTPASCDVIPNGTRDLATGQLVTYAANSGSVVPVAPDLKGQFVDQFGGSIEYEIITDLSLGFVYNGTRLGRVIEDMSTDDGANYFIANPGVSKPFSDPTTGALLNPRSATSINPVTLREYTVNVPKAERNYDSFSLELRKSLSKHWLAQASYTFSSLRGNFPGLFSSEYGNQLDPNILAEYDLVSLMPNRYGPLPNDMPHQIKVFGAYLVPINDRVTVDTGLNLRARTGTPVNYLGAHPQYGPGSALIMPRGSAGRTPFLTNVDLRGGLEYKFSAYVVKFQVDVFNILNMQRAVSLDQNYTFDDVLPITNGVCTGRNVVSEKDVAAAALKDCPDLRYLKTTDGRPVTVNKNYGRPTAFQAPLSVRFGLQFLF